MLNLNRICNKLKLKLSFDAIKAFEWKNSSFIALLIALLASLSK
jgi:hypothetical protein